MAPTIREFERILHQTPPFDNKPSGSDWSIKQLNWLELHYEKGCAVENVFKPQRPLLGSSAVFANLTKGLEQSWHDIMARQDDSSSVYGRLRILGAVNAPETSYVQQVVSPSSSQMQNEGSLPSSPSIQVRKSTSQRLSLGSFPKTTSSHVLLLILVQVN
jgi:hypothetical protein